MLDRATDMASTLELGMNSVERMTDYLEYDSEASPVLPHNRCRCIDISTRLRHAIQQSATYSGPDSSHVMHAGLMRGGRTVGSWRWQTWS